mgnify:CR=1 FL=1
MSTYNDRKSINIRRIIDQLIYVSTSSVILVNVFMILPDIVLNNKLYLKQKKTIEIPEKRRKGNGSFLKLKGASGHNLKNVNLTVPLGTLTCVTGVSGSGKSSLINYTLYPILLKHIYKVV